MFVSFLCAVFVRFLDKKVGTIGVLITQFSSQVIPAGLYERECHQVSMHHMSSVAGGIGRCGVSVLYFH